MNEGRADVVKLPKYLVVYSGGDTVLLANLPEAARWADGSLAE
jgi:hypothetical protein